MSHRPIRLVLDFDGTLTQHDTLYVVAGAGYRRQQSRASISDHRRSRLPPPPWQEIVDRYIQDARTYEKNYSPKQSARRTWAAESRYLDSLVGVEQASADRANAVGIFDEVTRLDLEEAAGAALESGWVSLRPGWAELLAAVYRRDSAGLRTGRRGEALQVLSVNWSRWFVWSVIWKAASMLADEELRAQVVGALDGMAVYANEFDSVVSSGSDLAPALATSLSFGAPAHTRARGHPVTMRTSGDKARQMNAVSGIDDHDNEGDLLLSDRTTTVYVGDSTTDLGCLVQADVGICVRDEEMSSGQKDLQSTCERIGIPVFGIDRLVVTTTTTTNNLALQSSRPPPPPSVTTPLLYHVSDLHEVARWVVAVTSVTTDVTDTTTDTAAAAAASTGTIVTGTDTDTTGTDTM